MIHHYAVVEHGHVIHELHANTAVEAERRAAAFLTRPDARLVLVVSQQAPIATLLARH